MKDFKKWLHKNESVLDAYGAVKAGQTGDLRWLGLGPAVGLGVGAAAGIAKHVGGWLFNKADDYMSGRNDTPSVPDSVIKDNQLYNSFARESSMYADPFDPKFDQFVAGFLKQYPHMQKRVSDHVNSRREQYKQNYLQGIEKFKRQSALRNQWTKEAGQAG